LPESRDDPLEEALRLVAVAKDNGLQVRLMGGLAFHARSPEWTALVERRRRDIDLATRKKDSRPLAELMRTEGYTPDRQFNALYGHKQMYFADEPRERPVDVLIDRLEMCHKLEFADRLAIADRTLAPADLLLSKLQIVKINRKDILDMLALMSDYPLAETDDGGSAISLARIKDVAGNDWGWWRTIKGNLAHMEAIAEHDLQPGELDFGRPRRFEPAAQVRTLDRAIEDAPKSGRWKLRARVGERVRWYEDPEEVGHGRV
jgi:hypothetical protein